MDDDALDILDNNKDDAASDLTDSNEDATDQTDNNTIIRNRVKWMMLMQNDAPQKNVPVPIIRSIANEIDLHLDLVTVATSTTSATMKTYMTIVTKQYCSDQVAKVYLVSLYNCCNFKPLSDCFKQDTCHQ